MKRINHFNTARDKLLHIETEGCIVNIRVGLADFTGRPITSIEVLPDTNGNGYDNTYWFFADEPEAKALNVRIAQQTKTKGG